MNQWYSSPLHTYPTSNSSHQFHSHKLRLSVRIQSVTVQSVQSPGPFSVVWLSRFKQKKPRGQCPFSLSFHYNKGGAVPNKDGHLSVGSDFVSFLQDVFEERDNDCCNMEDLQLSVEDSENRAEWRRITHVADPYVTEAYLWLPGSGRLETVQQRDRS